MGGTQSFHKMNASGFRSASFKQLGRAGRREMCRQMITGMGITLGFFHLSHHRGSTRICPFPMQSVIIRQGNDLLLQVMGKNSNICLIPFCTTTVILMWAHIMGCLEITLVKCFSKMQPMEIPLIPLGPEARGCVYMLIFKIQ